MAIIVPTKNLIDKVDSLLERIILLDKDYASNLEKFREDELDGNWETEMYYRMRQFMVAMKADITTIGTDITSLAAQFVPKIHLISGEGGINVFELDADNGAGKAVISLSGVVCFDLFSPGDKIITYGWTNSSNDCERTIDAGGVTSDTITLTAVMSEDASDETGVHMVLKER